MSVSGIQGSASLGGIPAAPLAAPPTRMYPKEHGAYAILGVPLVVALVIVGVSPATVLFSIAAFAAFLAHEPMLIVNSCRGNRVRQATQHAGRVLVKRLLVAVSCGLLAFALSSQVARLGMLLCLLFAAIEVAVAMTGRSRLLAAQLVGLAGLTLPGAVLLTIGGVGAEVASQFWLIWFIGRVATTVSVRTAIARHRHSVAALKMAHACDALLILAIVVCVWGMFAWQLQWLVTIPLLLSAVLLRILVPHPKHLKQMGWSLLAVNVLSGAFNVYIW